MAPVGYPGNSITKAARAKAGGGFESAIEEQSGGGGTPDGESIWGPYIVGTKPTGNIFSDGFETGSFDDTQTASGAGWDRIGSVSVSLVTDQQTVLANNDNGDFASPGGPYDKDWEGSPMGGGSNACRCRFSAGTASWSELQFNLGTDDTPEAWLSWDMRVPTNFFHRSGGGDNNKILRLYHDNYDVSGKVGMEFRPDADGSGSSVWYVNSNSSTANSFKLGDSKTFCRVPEDRGRWMRVKFHAVCETSPGANDGVIEVWRRWQDEAEFTKEFEFTGLDLERGDAVVDGFVQGYLLGYANSGYIENTEWLIDNFAVGTEAMI